MSYSNKKMPTSEDVRALMEAVASSGCSLHHFETMPHFNGCWELIIQYNRLLIRFFWDGRDDLLLVDETDYNPTAKQLLWHRTFVPKVNIDEVQEPFRYMEEVLKNKFPSKASPKQ